MGGGREGGRVVVVVVVVINNNNLRCLGVTFLMTMNHQGERSSINTNIKYYYSLRSVFYNQGICGSGEKGISK